MIHMYYSVCEYVFQESIKMIAREYHGINSINHELILWHRVNFMIEEGFDKVNGFWEPHFKHPTLWPDCPQVGDIISEPAIMCEGDEDDGTYCEYVTKEYFMWKIIQRRLVPTHNPQSLSGMLDMVVELIGDKKPSKDKAVKHCFDEEQPHD